MHSLSKWQCGRGGGGGGEGRAGLIYYSLEMENLTFVPQFLSLQPPPGNTLHILWTLDGVRLVQVDSKASTGELLKLVPKKGADKVYNQCRSGCRLG